MKDRVYSLQGVGRSYDGAEVLSIDHLDVFRGEVLAVVGPSGSGKTTLLRLLNFLEPPSSGAIECSGYRIGPQGRVPLALQRRVTTVFQHSILLDRTVRANVAFGLSLRGQRRANEQVNAALQSVGLLDLADRRARTLSGGEAQRVALARALVLEPEVLLLDEPTANLDPANVSMIEDIARRVNEERGTTIVLVTHNVFQARRLAHRVAFLLAGALVEVEEVGRFFNEPHDPRTRAFVSGEMVY